MLAEKFILYLESLIRLQSYPDGSPRVISTSPHIPVRLPERKIPHGFGLVCMQ